MTYSSLGILAVVLALAPGECSGGGGGAGGSGGAGAGGSGGTSGCTPNYSCTPPPPPATGDAYADCVARINQFRACVCLPPLARWTAGESCANQDAVYDRSVNTPHAGFTGNICSPQGWAENECLGGTINSCIQMMFDEGPPPTGSCTGTCYQQHGHYINMTNTRYTQVACGFGGSWAVQNFQ